jgi:predicted RNase H-like HicB family nuclease
MTGSFEIELELETDGRWIAEVAELPSVLAYGTTRGEASAKSEALANAVMQDRSRIEENR